MRRSSTLGRRPGRRNTASRRHGLALESLEPRLALAGLVLSGPTQPVFEGEQAVFTLQLAQRSSTMQSVFVTTTQGSATLGVDYMAPAKQQILFAPGQLAKTFSIPTLKDVVRQREGRETFVVTATPADPALSGPLSRTVSIVDFVAKPTISVGDVRVVEGNSGTTTPATFEIRLGSEYPLDVTVAYATRNGSATAAEGDFVAASGTLVFAPGETVKTVAANVNGDQVLEPDEAFSLVLSNPVNGTLLRSVGTCTIVNDEPDQPGFQITLTFANPSLPAEQKAVFERAVGRIQQIIVGDVPGVTPAGGQFIDDMRIQAFVEPMAANLNGYAQPTQMRSGAGGLPYEGEIHINSARIGNPGIYHTVIHEMLHAMGFLSEFFTATNTVSGLGTNRPLFTGANAVREYGTSFGIASPTGVPLYGDQSAAGSYGSHWDTGTIGTEVMSVGWDTTSTALRPFSRITVGALQDIGYQVSYAAADAYSPPTDALRAQAAQAAAQASTTRAKSGSSEGIGAAPAISPTASRPSTSATTPTQTATTTPPTVRRTAKAATTPPSTVVAVAPVSFVMPSKTFTVVAIRS